ncbi:MAG: glycine zipper 2TM domain-containing protein [Limnobacter sp.]|nr:glycine zipper 2TM domain-containing protein [Limnobacter sp.]
MLAGCANSPTSGQIYRQGEAQRSQAVYFGTVESVREVTIQGDTNNVGTAAGGIVGGIAGSNIGKGKGAAVGAVLGAVAGGIAGQKIEQNAVTRPGYEITVNLDKGGVRAYVQDADEAFRPGQRVRVVTTPSGVARVTH